MGLVIDLFAGGGGASVGIEAALGLPVNHAVNHDELAITVHRRNHPHTTHYAKDVFEVDPRSVTKGEEVDYLWASPDCTHHSIARGGRPKESGIRALAWVVVDWARDVRPKVLFVENVKEFQDWGPLDEHGHPIKERKKETFLEWVSALRTLGYQVEWRVLDASKYGSPTKRLRFFCIARCDGNPICWPEPTHGTGPGLEPLRTAAQCIDWSIPCPSIFMTREEARKQKLRILRPLAEKTMWRIANGIRRYVLEAQKPFLIRVGHYSNITGDGGRFRGQGADQPLGTICAQGNDKALISPLLAKFRHDSAGAAIDKPMPTITAGGKRKPKRPATGNPIGVISPFLSKLNHTGKPGENTDRSESLEDPMSTVCASRRELGLIVPTIVTQQFRNAPHGVDEPLPTITGQDNKNTLVAAFVAKHFGGMTGHEPTRPLGTITARDHHGLGAAFLSKFRGTCEHGQAMDEPLSTITGGGNHIAEVIAFLTTYYGDGPPGQMLTEPLRTITSKHRLGLVTIEGTEYQIVDIGMRMLEPHELLLAQFGEYAEQFSFDVGQKVTKADRVRLIGNSVPPHVVRAIVAANRLTLPGMQEAA